MARFPDGHVTDYEKAVDAPLTILALMAVGFSFRFLVLAFSPIGARARTVGLLVALIALRPRPRRHSRAGRRPLVFRNRLGIVRHRDGADAGHAGRRPRAAVLLVARPHPGAGRRPSAAACGEPGQSQLRFDRTTGQWVIIAALRQDRTYKPPADQCPLCPGPTGLTSEMPAPDYDVVVFENRFPSLSGAGGYAVGACRSTAFVSAPGHGRCEVICFSSNHTGSFAELEAPHARAGRRRVAPSDRRLMAAPASSRCSASRTAARRSA